MSMGMRASKMLSINLSAYLKKAIPKYEAVNLYQTQWNQNFSRRIKAGYYLQQILGKNQVTHLSLKFLDKTPRLVQKLISLTHGQAF